MGNSWTRQFYYKLMSSCSNVTSYPKIKSHLCTTILGSATRAARRGSEDTVSSLGRVERKVIMYFIHALRTIGCPLALLSSGLI